MAVTVNRPVRALVDSRTFQWTNGSGGTIGPNSFAAFAGGCIYVPQAVLNGSTGTACIGGSYNVAKTTSQTWLQGEKVYWDPATAKFTNVAGSLLLAGFIETGAASAATEGRVILNADLPGV